MILLVWTPSLASSLLQQERQNHLMLSFHFAPPDGFILLHGFLLISSSSLILVYSNFAYSRPTSFLPCPLCGPFFCLFLFGSHSTPALVITDGWWCLAALSGVVDSRLGEKKEEMIYHAHTCIHSSAESLVSHRMIKSAWSMSFPHLLCRRMPPLPTTAHFFRGSCRGLSWAEGNMEFC